MNQHFRSATSTNTWPVLIHLRVFVRYLWTIPWRFLVDSEHFFHLFISNVHTGLKPIIQNEITYIILVAPIVQTARYCTFNNLSIFETKLQQLVKQSLVKGNLDLGLLLLYYKPSVTNTVTFFWIQWGIISW